MRASHHYGPHKIRSAANSKGPKRWKKRRIHKPTLLEGVRVDRKKKVKQMMSVLKKKDWHFRFKIEAISPLGCKYEGDGDTFEEAFLKALGYWRRALTDFIPRIPSVIEASKPPPAPKRRWRRTNLRWIYKRHGQRAYRRAYILRYMRLRRAKEQLEMTTWPIAA